MSEVESNKKSNRQKVKSYRGMDYFQDSTCKEISNATSQYFCAIESESKKFSCPGKSSDFIILLFEQQIATRKYSMHITKSNNIGILECEQFNFQECQETTPITDSIEVEEVATAFQQLLQKLRAKVITAKNPIPSKLKKSMRNKKKSKPIIEKEDSLEEEEEEEEIQVLSKKKKIFVEGPNKIEKQQEPKREQEISELLLQELVSIKQSVQQLEQKWKQTDSKLEMLEMKSKFYSSSGYSTSPPSYHHFRQISNSSFEKDYEIPKVVENKSKQTTNNENEIVLRVKFDMNKV